MSDDVSFVLLMVLLCAPFVLIAGGICWFVISRDRRKVTNRQAEIERTILAAQTGVVAPRNDRCFMKSCSNCGDFALYLPERDQLGRTYCSYECMAGVASIPIARPTRAVADELGVQTVAGQFCARCLATTTEKSCGNLLTINGIGLRLGGAKEHCPQCHSVVKSVYIAILFIPIWRTSKYRFLHLDRNRFFSRKVR
jgi:hypothetical protein